MMLMIKVFFTYYELADNDTTGVHVEVRDSEGKPYIEYQNFYEDEYEEAWKNQTEMFTFPSLDVAISVIESNPNMMERVFF